MWLEAEGYTPTRSEVRNSKTGETELLQLDSNCLLDTDETISEEQENIVYAFVCQGYTQCVRECLP